MDIETVANFIFFFFSTKYELQRDKTNKMTCVPGEDSDQPGY